ncbi:TELO2-interacting protein 1 homolog isoform X2 [Octopus bimaculoides]|uniref:TELO2-interacting protein 1 homolog isoform X2 n=1 Tax=Octopus bimaculoides TaxID=37653 RepID=UPI0022E79E5D|nr:TELO2-interacting protein 1 homolog isoform X2 [Octopus bimaculoides]
MDGFTEGEKLQRSLAFQNLQPLCVGLVKEPTVQKLELLKNQLKAVDREILGELYEYVLFPLRLILKQNTCKKDTFLTLLAQCTADVLSAATIEKWDTFKDLFVTFTVLLGSPEESNNKISTLSEELKLAIVDVLSILLKNSNYDVLTDLYTVKNITLLGHTVSSLLSLIEHEKMRKLRVSAMDCLAALSLYDNGNTKIRVKCGNMFSSFLPRISIVLSSVVTGDHIQGHQVIKTAIDTLRKIVLLTMTDKLIEESQKHIHHLNTDVENEKLRNLIVNRDQKWSEKTAEKLLIIVKQVGSIRQHYHSGVRLSLVEWAHAILNNCTRSMSNSVPVLLEVLVILSCDKYSNVASRGEKALKIFQQRQEKEQSRTLVEILEENLLGLVTTLPRQIRTSDDAQKLDLIKILSGYLKILGKNINNMLNSYPHLKRFSLALVQVLEFDCSNIKIVEETSHMLGEGASAIDSRMITSVQQPRKTYKHFHSDLILEELKLVLRYLGMYGDLNLLIDHFLDMFHETSLHRLQATYIINQILDGTLHLTQGNTDRPSGTIQDKETLHSIVSLLIDEYLAPQNFNLVTSHLHQENDPVEGQFSLLLYNNVKRPTIYDYNANILQICLFLEGFAVFAKVLNKDFTPFLLKTLYPLLEKLGDRSAYLSSTAYLSLTDICTYCEYRNIMDLIQQNADYLVNAITLRLRHLSLNSRCPLVLKVMLQFGNEELLPLVTDTITEVLECLDDYQTTHVTTFLQVLHELCSAIGRWFLQSKSTHSLAETNNKQEPEVTANSTQGVQWLVDYLTQYDRDKKMSAGDVDESEMKAEDEDVNENPASENNMEIEDSSETIDEKPVSPLHVTIVKDVLARVKHLMSSTDVHIQLLALDTVCAAIQSLQPHEDELLPQVHQLWSPLSQRFSDKKILVRTKALHTLMDISQVCGSFIRKRTVAEVYPTLCRYLSHQAPLSSNCSIAYTFTQEYKLQLLTLQYFGKLCQNLGVSSKEIESVASSCLFYLSEYQHETLQKAALTTFGILVEIDPDIMWFKLCSVWCPIVYTAKSPLLENIQFKTKNEKNEYSKNIELLFENPLLS